MRAMWAPTVCYLAECPVGDRGLAPQNGEEETHEENGNVSITTIYLAVYNWCWHMNGYRYMAGLVNGIRFLFW